METNEFWQVIDTVRSVGTDNQPFAERLVDALAARTPSDVFAYERRFTELHDAAYRWDLWAAAYLIAGGCSDDSFIDFRAGLIAQGQDWYEKALANPDNLAEHPVLASPEGTDAEEVLFYEEVTYAAPHAFARIVGAGEDFHAAYDAWKQAVAPTADSGPGPRDMGEDFDFDDDGEMHRRLPRLAALYLDGADN
ncbi:DUF4240 domain-containing protein [Embleya sp. NPDC001921]